MAALGADSDDLPASWDDVDLAHAVSSDPRPLLAVLMAFEERLALRSAGLNVWTPQLTSFYSHLWFPKIELIRELQEGIVLLLKTTFLDIERDAATGLDYSVWSWCREFSAIIPMQRGTRPPPSQALDFPEHPMHGPPALAHERGNPDAWRAFLADARHWLGRMRYTFGIVDVAGGGYARIRSRVAGYVGMIGRDPLPAVASGSIGDVYVSNPPPLACMLFLVLGYGGTGGEYETRRTQWCRPTGTFTVELGDYAGLTFSAGGTAEEIEEEKRGGRWVETSRTTTVVSGVRPVVDAQTGKIVGIDTSGARSEETRVVTTWNADGTESRTETDTGEGPILTDILTANQHFEAHVFDGFGIGGMGINRTGIRIPPHGRSLAVVGGSRHSSVSPESHVPAGFTGSVDITFSCGISALLDFAVWYRFKS